MNFRTKIGLLFVVTHFVILVYTFICKFLGGFTFEELTTLIALLIPLFSAYTTAVVKDIIKNNQQTADPEITYSRPFRFVIIFICSLFIIFLFTIITLKAFNYGFEDFEQLKLTVGVVEAIFGGYVAQLIFSIYTPEKTETPAGGTE
ncbi:MAG: hypothetical protein ABIP27_09380 [Flavobacterium circumlabens]|uniref:hypothetical protein n=1 Tax=Flavobacterium circumlabens TaxID=2133765 RepID=UPI00326720E4